ncbi:hypothetical protein AB0C52_19065 [Streptomyces sp. NPDC048717]|uniref:hypothetical protein n=1 Tax=Streptomyces sp. NPDC048717 TaxID=3154928 RepID=UPI0034210BAC
MRRYTEAASAQPAGGAPAVLTAPVLLPRPLQVAIVPAARPEHADIEDDQELVPENHPAWT